VTRLLGLGLDAALVYSPTGTRAARRGKDFGIRREDEDVGGLPEATGSPLMRSGSHKALTPPCQSVPYRAAGERHGSERDHRRRDWHLGAQTQRGEALGLPGARTSTHASTRNGRGRTARAGVGRVPSTGHVKPAPSGTALGFVGRGPPWGRLKVRVKSSHKASSVYVTATATARGRGAGNRRCAFP
jgi:hypothetical protein